jgi:hypothetical protein
VIDANITAANDAIFSASGPQASLTINENRSKTISAANDVEVSSTHSMSLGGTIKANNGAIALSANRDVAFAGSELSARNTLGIIAGRAFNGAGSITSQRGNISIATGGTGVADSSITYAGEMRANNDSILISAAGSQSSILFNAGSQNYVLAKNNISLTSGANITYGGATDTLIGNISLTAGNDINVSSITNMLPTGSISFAAGRDLLIGGTIAPVGNITFQANRHISTATNAYIANLGTISFASSAGNIKIIGTLSSGAGMELLTQLGNIDIGEVGRSSSISTGSGNLQIKALGVYDSTKSEANQIGNITVAPGSSIAISTGKLELNAASILKLSSITSSSNSLDAIKLRGFDVIHNSDTNADIRMNGNGWISLRAHRYIDINNIDYRGTSALYIEMTGVANSGNSAASAVAVGVTTTSASVELNKLYAGYAAVSASNVANFNVVDARITRTSFFNINNTIGRVGDIDVIGIDYAAWTGQNSGTSAFSLATAVASGIRNWDFNVSGTQATEGLAVLGFNLGLNYSGSKPVLETNAVVVNYRPLSYIYAGLSQDEIRAQEELAAAQRAQAALEAATEQARLGAIARAEALAAERLAAQLEADRLARLRALADAQRLARQFVPPPPPPVFVALPIIRPVLNITANVISFSSSPTQGMRSVTIQPASPSANTAPASSATSSSSNAEAGASSSSNAASGTSTTSTMESNSGSTTSAGSSSSTGTSASGNRDGEGGEGGATNQTTPNIAPAGTTNEVVQ